MPFIVGQLVKISAVYDRRIRPWDQHWPAWEHIEALFYYVGNSYG